MTLLNRGSRRAAGFTLVELLVTIAVIGVLLAILLPAVQQARQTARRVACLSNLHEWSVALQHYAEAHDGYLPRRGQGTQMQTNILNRPDDWFNALPPYMEGRPYIELYQLGMQPRPEQNSVWNCPEAVDTGQSPQSAYFAYGMNMWLSTWNNAPLPDNLDKVGPTTTMVFMADGPGPNCSVLPSNLYYSPVARHGGLVNIAFLDGHVTSLPGDVVGCGVGDPQLPDVRWVVPGSPWSGPAY